MCYGFPFGLFYLLCCSVLLHRLLKYEHSSGSPDPGFSLPTLSEDFIRHLNTPLSQIGFFYRFLPFASNATLSKTEFIILPPKSASLPNSSTAVDDTTAHLAAQDKIPLILNSFSSSPPSLKCVHSTSKRPRQSVQVSVSHCCCRGAGHTWPRPDYP